MDLNYLFHRQQVSLMMADAAARIARVRAAGGVSYPLRGL